MTWTIPESWDDRARQAWAKVEEHYANGPWRIARTGPAPHYFGPRPYVDEYNQGSNRHGFSFYVKNENTGYQDVGQSMWTVEEWEAL